MNNRVTITENPLPTVYNLISASPNPAIGCNGGTGHVVSLNNSDLGIDYTLYLDGTPIETLSGTGAQLDYSAQLGIGYYTITGENLSTGCIKDMSGTFQIQVV